MRILVTRLILGLCLMSVVSACGDERSYARSVYMLVDTSGTYTQELDKAQQIINYLLAQLNPGDWFAVARIDSASFSEKDIVAKVRFDARPSRANAQKRQFRDRVASFIESAKGSQHTDVSGGVLQAVEYLKETGAGRQMILLFSDLKEDLPKGHVRDFNISMDGIEVVAINVTKLRSDNVDPRNYLDRLETWEQRVTDGGGKWRVINDLGRIDTVLER